jgi:hypothetical protein
MITYVIIFSFEKRVIIIHIPIILYLILILLYLFLCYMIFYHAKFKLNNKNIN